MRVWRRLDGGPAFRRWRARSMVFVNCEESPENSDKNKLPRGRTKTAEYTRGWVVRRLTAAPRQPMAQRSPPFSPRCLIRSPVNCSELGAAATGVAKRGVRALFKAEGSLHQVNQVGMYFAS